MIHENRNITVKTVGICSEIVFVVAYYKGQGKQEIAWERLNIKVPWLC